MDENTRIESLAELEALLKAERDVKRYDRLSQMYPDTGKFARSKYPRHMQLLAASAKYRETAMIAGNGVGKTWGIGAYAVAIHATGLYPPWWVGKRIKGPARIWVAGKTRETTRDIIQEKLLGDVARQGESALGTGMIPKDNIIAMPRFIPNTNNAADYVRIRNVTGDESLIGFKSYEQGSSAFEGTEQNLIWLDEEPPSSVYGECLMRTRTVDGIILVTFTPLKGFSEVVSDFINWEKKNLEGGSKFMIQCGWDDVPHLDEKWKSDVRAATPPHLRKAREEGIPTAVGSMVYPVAEEDFVVRGFSIPPHFRRVFGLDSGWHNTAAVWLAYDKDEDIVYVYADYKRGELPTEVHAASFRQRGAWIPGVGDVAARDSGSGVKILDQYRAQGVKVRLADKAVYAGIDAVYSRLMTGRLKVFSNCQHLITEFRMYRYDDNNEIIKKDDHALDALRFAIMSGLKISVSPKVESTIYDEVRFG